MPELKTVSWKNLMMIQTLCNTQFKVVFWSIITLTTMVYLILY